MRVAILTVSDGCSSGEREDRSGDQIVQWCARLDYEVKHRSVVPDEADQIAPQLMRWADSGEVDVVLTTGGTGFSPRDVTPEATEAVADKLMPGFGELMRKVSLEKVATAILSRQTAAIRGGSLIVNLPGQPKAINECLDAVFPAIPYCIDLIGGPFLTTDESQVIAFRPKKK